MKEYRWRSCFSDSLQEVFVVIGMELAHEKDEKLPLIDSPTEE